ncbi:hypothetical protein Q75_07780 [Bacillus coahuilensis p1.1.43]|uniref:DUF2164 domain-containing protein n=1 Tax=Bacillus coahuilensis p1.1.43 TaxID=1150625 RepID=A0A147K893_9BACI|nr:DUF2164 domain-containing protein [Bacillus coahuilensis]KUP06429.1 hypothetical protein Q75_07780 [Bacillus coahuilensis p1.1.43]
MIPIKLPKQERDQILHRIITHHYEQTGDEMGEIAAENLLDFMLKEIGPYFYNQAVSDSLETLEQKYYSMEEDLQALKRPLLTNRR